MTEEAKYFYLFSNFGYIILTIQFVLIHDVDALITMSMY